MSRRFTRRQLLAGVGAAGLGAAGLEFLTGSARGYTHYTFVGHEAGAADRQEHDLRVAWWNSRNGEVIDTQGSGTANASRTLDTESAPAYVPDANGPILTASNVLPGDQGRLGIGLEAAIPDEQELAVWYRTVLVDANENGVNDPERAAGDTDDDGGELPDRLKATVWADTGAVGSCDGELTPGVESAAADGPLGEVIAALDGGQQLACLSGGDAACLGVRWGLPAQGPNINVVQGDSVTVAFEFRTATCDGGNPFDNGGDADG